MPQLLVRMRVLKRTWAQAGSSPLVVIGFSGVLWKNVTPELMPHLYRFIDDVAGANIVVRTVGETTCPN